MAMNDQMGDSYNEFFNRIAIEPRNLIHPFGVNTANDYDNNLVDRGEIIVEGNAINDYYNDGHEPVRQLRYQFVHEPGNIVRRLEFDSDGDDGDDSDVGNEQPIISRMVPISLDELSTLTSHASDEDIMCESCPICLEHYGTNSDVVCKLNCAHYFHISCLSQWSTRHHTCPLCRSQF